jgi:hypothetical protein
MENLMFFSNFNAARTNTYALADVIKAVRADRSGDNTHLLATMTLLLRPIQAQYLIFLLVLPTLR